MFSGCPYLSRRSIFFCRSANSMKQNNENELADRSLTCNLTLQEEPPSNQTCFDRLSTVIFTVKQDSVEINRIVDETNAV